MHYALCHCQRLGVTPDEAGALGHAGIVDEAAAISVVHGFMIRKSGQPRTPASHPSLGLRSRAVSAGRGANAPGPSEDAEEDAPPDSVSHAP